MITLPDGSTIYPKETINLGNVQIHKERWRVYIVGYGKVFVASADRGDTGGDGIYFDSYENWINELAL